MSEPELIELAVRLLYWATATAPCPTKHSAGKPAVDIGVPVRDAVTGEFARLLPERLRDALEIDRRHLHEIREGLDRQD